MTDQLEFFPPRKHRRNDPDTSRAAARLATDYSDEIMAVFDSGVWASDDSLVMLISTARQARGLPAPWPPSVKTCRSRLTHAGLLIDTGKRVLSERNRPMAVWASPRFVAQVDVPVRDGVL